VNPYAKMHTLTLERIRHVVLQEFSDDIIFDAQMAIHMDGIVIRAIRELYGQREELTVEYPADWREAFKERWFPKWALKRWPVMYKVHHIEAQRLFPELKGVGRRLEYAIFESKTLRATYPK
jgi:hypothetical protein